MNTSRNLHNSGGNWHRIVQMCVFFFKLAGVFVSMLQTILEADPILIIKNILGENRKNSYARFFVKPKVTNRFGWFSIANTGLPMATSYQNLNKIGQKFRPWECRIRKFKMAADDAIKLRNRKSEKNDTGPCPGDYLCATSSKLAQLFRLYSCK